MLIRQTLLYLPAQIGGPFLQFLTTILWTYWLAPGQFGQIAAIIAVQELSYLLFQFWWSSSALRYSLDIIHDRGKLEFQAMENAVLLVSGAFQIGFVPIILNLTGVKIDPLILFWCSLFVISRGLIAHLSERTRASSKILIYTHVQVLNPILSLILSYLMLAQFGSTIQTILSAYSIAQGFVVLSSWIWLSLGFGIQKPDPAILYKAARFGLPLMIGGILGWFSLNAIRIVVGYLYGSDQLGLLSVGWGLGQRFASVAAMLVTAASFPLAVASMSHDNKQSSLYKTALGGMLLFALLCPATIGIAFISDSLITIAISESFRSVTMIVLPIAMLASAIRNFRVHYPDQSLLLLEVTSLTIWINLFEAVLTLALCYIGAINGGPIGAVYGCLIGSFFWVA